MLWLKTFLAGYTLGWVGYWSVHSLYLAGKTWEIEAGYSVGIIIGSIPVLVLALLVLLRR